MCRIMILLLLLLLPVAAQADDKVEEARKQYLAEKVKLQTRLHLERIVMAEEIADILQKVHDVPSAQAAGPRLDGLHARIEKHAESTAESMKNTEPEVKKEVMSQISERMLRARRAIAQAHEKIFKEQPAAYRALEKCGFVRLIQKNAEEQASDDVNYFKEALDSYLRDNPYGPGNLQELLDWKEKPYTPLLPKLKDPWGQEYQFKVVTTFSGDKDDVRTEAKGYVWTISPYGDGKKIIGKKP